MTDTSGFVLVTCENGNRVAIPTSAINYMLFRKHPNGMELYVDDRAQKILSTCNCTAHGTLLFASSAATMYKAAARAMSGNGWLPW
jgi:hypothetical protein